MSYRSYHKSHSTCCADCACTSAENACRNDRIKSDTTIQCQSLFTRQDFCVNARVGVEEATAQQLVENTIFKHPGDPIRPWRLLTVIARNISQNFVNVEIQRDVESNGEITLADAVVPPNSEVALSAPEANKLIASASSPSRVLFFITVFYPGDPVHPTDPIFPNEPILTE